MQDLKDVLVTRSDIEGVTHLTLMRPAKFNALSFGVLEQLQESLDQVASDPCIKVIVIASTGKAFCAGHDLKEMRHDSSEVAMRALFSKCSEVMMKISSIPQPVIAQVHGIATAAGCQLVASCDLAVASDQARFATSGINVGLFCSTPMVALTRNVGTKKAFEMLVTGDFISAEEALQYGLVNQVVAPEELDNSVMTLAQKIVKQPHVSIAMGKQLFYNQMEAARCAAYEMASDTMANNMMTEDARAGIDAFIAKKPMPKWKGR